MAFLPRLLLRERVNAICNLQFLWTVHGPPSQPSPIQQTLASENLEKAKKRGHYYRRTWNAIWKNLAEMEGLVDLRVELHMLNSRDHQWEAQEFNQVRSINRPRKFHLVLPERTARRIEGKVETGNCTIESIEKSL
jgi:hypothetical protein